MHTVLEKTTGGVGWKGGRNPNEIQSQCPTRSHPGLHTNSSWSCPHPWLILEMAGVRAGVLFFRAAGVSRHFPPNQSPSCSIIFSSGGVGVREGLSSFSFFIPPTLNIVFQLLQAGFALSPRLLTDQDVSPGQTLFGCSFLSSPASSKIPLLFSLFLASNKLHR